MEYNCAHCGRWIVVASGFRSFTTDCQHCGAQNTFHFSPTAVSHRPPSGIELCSEGNCNLHSTTQPEPAAAHPWQAAEK